MSGTDAAMVDMQQQLGLPMVIQPPTQANVVKLGHLRLLNRRMPSLIMLSLQEGDPQAWVQLLGIVVPGVSRMQSWQVSSSSSALKPFATVTSSWR